jgi:NAD(P)-dependent dehydrogenase (short-subunit alcohol dehydrogenase family)
VSRSILIIGASSGIGLATALRLAADDDRLALVAREGAALAGAERACRARGATEVRTFAADMAVESEVQRVVAAVDDAYGGIDVVVHTATVMAYGTVADMPSDIFTTVVDTAVRGTLYLAQAVVPRFRRQGHGTLVIVNSLLGSITVPTMGAYATAKWGQRAIARTLQQEVRGDRGVHVCIVSPGSSTNTPIYYQAANYLSRQARPPVPVLQPERVAESIAALTVRPRKHVSVPVGPPNPVIITGYRLLPFVFDRIVGPLFRLGALTRTEQPPTAGNVKEPIGAEERVFGRWPERR